MSGHTHSARCHAVHAAFGCCVMTPSDLEIVRSATLFLELHGEEAIAKARDNMRERSDNDGADRWLRIFVEMESQQRRAIGAMLQ